MTEVKEILRTVEDIVGRYGLRSLYLDFTDTTLISRIGFSSDIFIQFYVNIPIYNV